MYKGSISTKKEILIHLIFWLIWIYYTLMTVENVHLFFITGNIVYLLTFYVNYFLILPNVFAPFRWKKAWIGFLIIFLFFSCSRFLTEQVITLHFFNQQNYLPGTPFLYYLYDNLFYSSKPVILSTVLWSMIFLVRTLEYNQLILEENKNTEIKFLKAQINPHFVFNTLNNIYSMVYFKSEKSLPAIEKLSQIMQFTTYEAQKEKILLAGEINYILAYIELEKLRHREESFLISHIELADESVEIPPFILSPLVENALKHGMMSDESPIRMNLQADKHQLVFQVENQIGNQKKDKLGGIGLENLKKRLEIHYPGKHTLEITSENSRFCAKLEIELT